MSEIYIHQSLEHNIHYLFPLQEELTFRCSLLQFAFLCEHQLIHSPHSLTDLHKSISECLASLVCVKGEVPLKSPK